MANFRIAPSPERRKLEDDLFFIHNHITYRHQYALLEKRALKPFKYRWIPGRREKAERILDVVAEVRTKISAIPPGSSSVPNSGCHEQFRDAIQEGTRELNSLTNRSSDRIQKDDIQEIVAIQLDQNELVEDLRLRASLIPPSAAEIKVYLMDEPTEHPRLTIPARFQCYSEISWFLHQYYRTIAAKPELWGRLRSVPHGMGTNGYRWEFGAGPARIVSQEVDIVDMEQRWAGDYIVALAHDTVTGQERPLPLDIAQWYDVDNQAKWCCNPPCGNLRAHLQHHWPDRYIAAANCLEDPTISVIDRAFHTNTFAPRTNNLYLQWEPLNTPVNSP